MEPAVPLWTATASASAFTAAAIAIAGITRNRAALYWAGALSALLLRILLAHVETALGPSQIVLFAARCASPLFTILFVAGVAESEGAAPLKTALPAALLTFLWLALATAWSLGPFAATGPAEFAAGVMAAALALGPSGARPLWLTVTLWLLAVRALARPLLYAFPASPQLTLIVSTALWAVPALGAMAASVSALKSEAATERRRGEALAAGSDAGVAVADEAGCCVYANAAMAGLLGLTPAETTGAPVAKLLAASGTEFVRVPLQGGGGEAIFAQVQSGGDDYPRKLFEFASAVADGAALVSPETGRVITANGVWQDLLAESGDGFGAELWAVAIPGGSARLMELTRNGAASGEPFETDLRGPGGKRLRTRLTVTEVEWDGSLLWQVSATVLPDTSETRGKLETSGELAAGLAHDLKNVLQAILSCSDGLSTSGTSDEKALKAISEAARRGDSLVKRILDPAKARPDARRFDLAALVSGVVELAKVSAPSSLEVGFVRPPNPVCVVAAPEEIEQAVMNLIVNAREALGGNGRISVSVTGGKCSEATVEDSGPGVPKEMREKVFLPLVSSKARSGGIGLAMVRASAERFGGKVSVGESETLGGAKFTLSLPPAPPGGVILADSDAASRALLDRELKLSGRMVWSTPSGDRALALIREKGDEVSAVVADLVLEGTGGRRFLESARDANPGLRIVVVSSITGDAAREGSLKAGASVFFPKPFDPASVVEALGGA